MAISSALAVSKLRLSVPAGVGLGASAVFRVFSTSRCAISCSICDLNSFEARRNSLSTFPTWRAISGNFFGPKIISARKKRKIVSEKLMLLHHTARQRNAAIAARQQHDKCSRRSPRDYLAGALRRQRGRVLPSLFAAQGTPSLLAASHEKDLIRPVTNGNRLGSRPSNEVVYCVYSP